MCGEPSPNLTIEKANQIFDEIETEKDIPDLFSVILIVTMLANFVLEFCSVNMLYIRIRKIQELDMLFGII